jgi:hypothetical protein
VKRPIIAACANCGRPARRDPVKVIHKRTGERSALRLCDECAVRPARAVWLKWEPDGEVKAARR